VSSFTGKLEGSKRAASGTCGVGAASAVSSPPGESRRRTRRPMFESFLEFTAERQVLRRRERSLRGAVMDGAQLKCCAAESMRSRWWEKR